MNQNITPQAFHEIYEQGKVKNLIDVRTPTEYRSAHITGSKNVPLQDLSIEGLQQEGITSNGEAIYVICQSGGRAKQACQVLSNAKFSDVYLIDGGINEWKKANLPLVLGKQVMSLERQVRIAAGSLVVLGVVLSIFVHPYLLGISAFVGAGLVFAGITDTCGMGLMLAKMPWNQ